jgi:hypothetical protein
MREKIRSGGHDSPYRLRKQLPEPVFGQIKQGHNLLKLAQGRSLSETRPMAPKARLAVA